MFKCVINSLLTQNIYKSAFYLNKSRVLLVKSLPVCHNLYFLQDPRHLHAEIKPVGKLFTEVENSYAYDIVKPFLINTFQFTEPTATISTEQEFIKYLNENWRHKTATEIATAFKAVQKYCSENDICVEDARFDKLVDGLMDNAENLSDTELSDLLVCLRKFPMCSSWNAHNYHDIWSCLDDMCVMRLSNWDTDTMLHFADHWYHLYLAKISDYIFNMIDRIERRAKAVTLTKEQILKTYFCINACRRKSVPFELEYCLERFINDITADEMGVIAMGYFKSQTKLKLVTVADAMCKRIIEERESIHEVTLAAILKILRYSGLTKNCLYLSKVLENFVSQIDRLSHACCIHLALLGTNLQIYNADVLQKVSEKILTQLSDAEKIRVKDIERLLLSITMFDFEPKTNPDIFKTCYEEIHRVERLQEYVQYPRSLMSVLNYLSICNVYSYELTSRILDQEFIKEHFGKQKCVPRELFSLDSSIDIECPGYQGNRLNEKQRTKVSFYFTEYTPMLEQPKKHSLSDKLFLDVYDIIARIIGSEKYLTAQHILPHFSKPDIILCKNTQTGKYVEPLGLASYNHWDVKYPKKEENLKWYAVMPLSINCTVRNAPLPLGAMKMKARQLRVIGYEPVMVFWSEYSALTYEEKLEYVKNKLSCESSV